MTKTTQVQKFENGNIIDADEVNQAIENAGSLGGVRPYNNTGAVNTSGDKDVGESSYPMGNSHHRSDKELKVYDPITKTLVASKSWLQVVQGGSGGGAGLELAELKSHLEKQGINYPLSNSGLHNESFTDTANVVITPRVSYVSGTTLIADINKADIDLMNATTGWTAGTNTPTIAQDTTNKIEGTGSVKMTKASLNGSMDMYKTFTAFSLIDNLLCFSFFPDTVTNVTRFYVTIESSANYTNTYYVPVANITASAFNHICIDPTNDTADGTGSSGSAVKGSITKIYFGYTTSSSQTVNVSVDFVVYTPNWIMPLPYSTFIWDGTNQEPLYIASVVGTANHQRNTYTITALSNGYAVGAAYAKERNVTISNNHGVIPSALSGAVAKTVYDQTTLWLPDQVAGATLYMSQRWWDEEFKISTIVSTSSFKVSSATDKKAYFLDNDWVIVYNKRYVGRKYASRYNSTVTKNFYLLQLNANSTHASGEITFTHDGTNAGIDTSYWYCVRYSAEMLYKVENMAENGALNTLVPTIFSIYDNSGNPVFSEYFTGVNGAVPANWAFTSWEYSGAYSRADIRSNMLQMGPGNWSAGTSDHSGNNKASYSYGINFDKSLCPVTIRARYATFGREGSGHEDKHHSYFMYGENGGANHTEGVGLHIDEYYGVLYLRYNSTDLVSASLTQTAGTYYQLRMEIGKNYARIKVWTDGNPEPVDWNINYVYTSDWTFVGNKICVSKHGGGRNTSEYINVDEITVRRESSGYYVRGEAKNQSGDKLVTATKLTRQDTTNQNPYVYQRDALLA